MTATPDTESASAHAEYAYSPRQGARSIAREHAILDQPVRVGRFRRDAGDALCKPRRAFWGLDQGSTNCVSCPRCLELAKRYSVKLPVLRWHYGPTAADPNPGSMWCYDCGGEVWTLEDGYICKGCGRQADQ